MNINDLIKNIGCPEYEKCYFTQDNFISSGEDPLLNLRDIKKENHKIILKNIDKIIEITEKGCQDYKNCQVYGIRKKYFK